MSTPLDRLTAALADRYTLEREVGAGGMATVYLAHDVKHDRKVALKVLRPELAAVIGAERFLAEIKTTANLQHPHILALFDSGQVDGTVFYVMPYVEGESLRDRLARETQLGIADAVRIAREVASALDYAHRHGVIHRDIKPENILLHDGQALVADFGIALAASKSEGSTRMTETGMSLGTPHYMSPEQAMGERDLDARTDIYALGCMLYEMLAGETPFTGPSAQAIIAKVMSSDPEPVTTLRRTAPPHVAAAVHMAIQKLPADRFESAARFSEALGSAAAGATLPQFGAVTPPLRRNRPALLFAGLAVLASLTTVWALSRPGSADGGRVSRFALAVPPGQELANPGGTRLAISPDGEGFVYPGPGEGRSQLWFRRFDALEAVPIQGGEGLRSPAFSPDGSEIAGLTYAPFAVRIVPAAGGTPRLIIDDPKKVSGGGLAWSEDGFLYIDGGTGLARIRPDGSDWEMVMPLDSVTGETGVGWPTALPGGGAILFRVRRGGEAPTEFRIVAYDVRNRVRKEIVRGVLARYSTTGHLLWVTADGVLHAQRFDPERLEFEGSPVVIVEGLSLTAFSATDLALSPDGDLIYSMGAIQASLSAPVWVDRQGVPTRVDSTVYNSWLDDLRISPDGSTAAFEMVSAVATANLGSRIWVKRLDGGPTQLVTTESISSRAPIWSADGRELFYVGSNGTNVYRQKADGSGDVTLILREPRGVGSMALSRDETTLLLATGVDGRGQTDILQFRVGVDSVARLLLAGSAEPALSPDGRWLAVSSGETSRSEVYVRPFPDVNAGKVLVSSEGGYRPRWNPAGGELFYVSGSNELMAATIRTAPALAVGSVVRLFSVANFHTTARGLLYDVVPDGRRFLMNDASGVGDEASIGTIVVVQNFARELNERLPR